MFIIILALTIAAVYSAGAYAYAVYQLWDYHRNGALTATAQDRLAEWSFRLALCFVLSVGFIGIIIS